jgi:hypothetical protein
MPLLTWTPSNWRNKGRPSLRGDLTKVQRPIHPLRLAVALLIVLGLVETAALIAAIFNKTSFAGGSILYIYAGWRLSRKDARTYNVVVIWLSVFLALLVGGVFFSGVNAIQIALTPGLHLDVTGDLPLLFVGFVYIAVIPVLLALLFHPATRNEFGKPIRGTSPWTLYLSVPNLVGLSIAGMLLGALFIGPYWLINPYQVVTHALSSDPLVARDQCGPKSRGRQEYRFLLCRLVAQWVG